MPYGRDKLALALALPPSPPGFLPSGKNQEAPKKSPPKEEFEKILFKAAFELGMPDPNQNPEETLDWLLKKQKERKLTIQEWAEQNEVEWKYIQPGKLPQNAFVERFNGTLRQELLNLHIFDDLEQVRNLSEPWIEDYNKYGPHKSLGYVSPLAYAQKVSQEFLKINCPV